MSTQTIVPAYLKSFIKKDNARKLAMKNKKPKEDNSELTWPAYKEWFKELNEAIKNAAECGKTSTDSPSLSRLAPDGWLTAQIRPEIVRPVLKKLGYTIVTKTDHNTLRISF